ncbi:MAG: ATP-binding protein [Bacteroidales bacterium]|nr:ATP-binding protein [Bacteroidales bacterium]
MERLALHKLKTWKAEPDRKPLIIRGARQVGKTWLMKEFGEREYSGIAYINFESSKHLRNLFLDDFHIPRIITAIQIETGVRIEAENTLIILDEIQEAPGAITSLKYFYENTPQYHVISAGSLLGVALHQKISYPVGKVEFLDLFPMSFPEFLMATDQQPLLELIERMDWDLLKSFKGKLVLFLRYYYYVGGMPEAVNSFVNRNDFQQVRKIQKDILTAYDNDFSKHAPLNNVPRIRMLWNSIPSQLAKENRKFLYKVVKTGSRAKDYELALNWLSDSGLVHKIYRVSKPGFPLKSYEDQGAFKLFITDVGLLGAMGDIDVRTLLEGNVIFQEFEGALTEQYVLQQLLTDPELAIFYWSADRSTAEIDFLVQYSGRVIPVEVKAEENLRAKSLRFFCQKYDTQTAIRTSMSDYREESWMTNLPLYAIHLLTQLDRSNESFG